MMRLRIALVTAVVAGAMAVAPTASPQPENRQATFGNLIAALNNINVQIDRLNVLSNITGDVRVVNVEDVLSGNNIEALNNALNNNDVDINVLRDFLNNNDCSVIAVCNSLNDALDDNVVLIQDVIAVNVLSGGDVIIFENS
jgi:hypothetical protein